MVGMISRSPSLQDSVSVRFEDPTGLLAKLRQTTNIRDYQEQFEGSANRTEGLSESFTVSCFVAGRKEEIRLGVQMFRPKSLMATTSLARLQEEKGLAGC